MDGLYLEKHEIKQLDKLLKHDDTIPCWIKTRILDHSPSLVCNGNISVQLLKMLDEEILPLLDETKRTNIQGSIKETSDYINTLKKKIYNYENTTSKRIT